MDQNEVRCFANYIGKIFIDNNVYHSKTKKIATIFIKQYSEIYCELKDFILPNLKSLLGKNIKINNPVSGQFKFIKDNEKLDYFCGIYYSVIFEMFSVIKLYYKILELIPLDSLGSLDSRSYNLIDKKFPNFISFDSDKYLHKFIRIVEMWLDETETIFKQEWNSPNQSYTNFILLGSSLLRFNLKTFQMFIIALANQSSKESNSKNGVF